MRYVLLSIVTLLGLFHNSLAQDFSSQTEDSLPVSRRAKAIYVEALGTSGFGFSINYDMRFKPGHDGWGFRIGSGQISREGRYTNHSFPLLINKVSTNKRVAFEQGIGALITYRKWYYDNPSNTVDHYRRFLYHAAVNVGLRVQPENTGVIWRLYWSPAWIIGVPINSANLLWFGTSLGIGFN